MAIMQAVGCSGDAATCRCWWHRPSKAHRSPDTQVAYGLASGPPFDFTLPRNRVDVQARVNDLLARRHTMVDIYLPMKHQEGDWHGVQDAASDLRDIDAELKGLR